MKISLLIITAGIVFGQTVSRNEFGIEKGEFYSPDSTKVAFYRNDQSRVALFPYMDIAADNHTHYERYPMNSSLSERLSIGVCTLATKDTVYLQTYGEFSDDQYLTNVTWSPGGTDIYVQVLDRQQQNLRLIRYDAASGARKDCLLEEHSDTWVEPSYPLYWIKGNDRLCIYSTDNRDGWWNLYILDVETSVLKRLAHHDHQMNYLSNDGKYVYFEGPDDDVADNYLWRASIRTGKVEKITEEKGWHDVRIAADCKSFIDEYQTVTSPVTKTRITMSGKVVESLKTDANALEYPVPIVETGTLPSVAVNGETNHYRIVKPYDFDPSKKYPLILYVYDGPHSQMVTNKYLAGARKWELYASMKGFIIVVIDGNGTERHSAAYAHSIYRHCGTSQLADQVAAIEMIKEKTYIDSDRIGVYGWSYGGFMSLTLATTYPELFKVSVAGGPVIDWRWYEVMYGERYMGRTSDNADGLEETSLINKVKNLKAKTLVIQGNLDPTVVPLNALSFIQACIDADKQVDYFTYPKSGHNMRGHDRIHLMDKVTDYFVNNL